MDLVPDAAGIIVLALTVFALMGAAALAWFLDYNRAAVALSLLAIVCALAFGGGS